MVARKFQPTSFTLSDAARTALPTLPVGTRSRIVSEAIVLASQGKFPPIPVVAAPNGHEPAFMAFLKELHAELSEIKTQMLLDKKLREV